MALSYFSELVLNLKQLEAEDLKLKSSQGFPLCPTYDMRMHNHTAKYDPELQLIFWNFSCPHSGFIMCQIPTTNLKLTDTWYANSNASTQNKKFHKATTTPSGFLTSIWDIKSIKRLFSNTTQSWILELILLAFCSYNWIFKFFPFK